MTVGLGFFEVITCCHIIKWLNDSFDSKTELVSIPQIYYESYSGYR